jgi:hypothetical protein
MKKILLIISFLLIASFAQAEKPMMLASMNSYIAGCGYAVGVAYPGFSYDMVEDFENALASPWSETDTASRVNVADDTAEYRGTYGMSYAASVTDAGYAVYDFATSPTTVSLGFWFKTGTYANKFAGITSWMSTYSDGGSTGMYMRGGGNDSIILLGCSLNAGGDIEVANATWYWVTMKLVRNGAAGTSSMAIYNTAGSQVGSTITFAFPDEEIQFLRFGFESGTASSTAVFYDEIYVDWTDGTFPLGPPSGS